MDSDALRYVSEIRDELDLLQSQGQEGSENKEAVELLLRNAFEECSRNPASVLCDSAASWIFETFLVETDGQLLLDLLRSIGNQLFYISSNPFGSHVLEKLLKTIYDDQLNMSTEVVEEAEAICRSVVELIGEFVGDKFATHIVRRLVCILGRVDAISIVNGKKPETNQAGGLISHKRPAAFVASLFSLVDAARDLAATDSKIAKDLVCSSVSSPTIQVMLVAVSAIDDSKFCNGVLTFLGSDGRRIDESICARLMSGKCSSHFMQIVLQFAPKALLDRLIDEVLLPCVSNLCLHPCANFPIQAAIDRIDSKTTLAKVVDQIDEKFADIIRENRIGVIISLLRKSLELGENAVDVMNGVILAVTKLSRAQGGGICEYLLTSGTDAVIGENFRKLSHHGCVLLETLLNCPKESIDPVLKSIRSLNSSAIKHLASDSCGSRVLEAAFRNGTIPSKVKKALLDKLSGQWTQMAMSSSASHLLEACFDFAKPELKIEILKSLEGNEPEICRTKWGSAALRHCKSTQLDKGGGTQDKLANSKREHESKISGPKKWKRQKRVASSFLAPSYGSKN